LTLLILNAIRFQDLSAIPCGKVKDHQDGSWPKRLLKRDEILAGFLFEPENIVSKATFSLLVL
jgi:hypothetical protein